MDHPAQEPTWHKSACNLCYINCGLELGVEGTGTGARIVRVRGDRDNPRTRGYLCNKAQSIPNYVHHGDRLTTPLRRSADGTHEPISWETAIQEIAERLGSAVAAHGGRCIALGGSGGQGNHAGGFYSSTFLRALGCRTVFHTWAQEKTGDAWLNGHMFGSQACRTAEDVHHCDLLLLIGTNPKIAHGFVNAREHLNEIRKDPARKLIVIDPRRTESAEAADLHLAIRPGSDAFLMGALLAELHRRRAFDEEFLVTHALGVDEVKAALASIPIAQWLAAADVTADDFECLVQMVIEARAMVVRVELGVQQGLNSTLNAYFEKLLILMTGNFGRRGTNWLHDWLGPFLGNSPGVQHASTGAELICGFLSPNRMAEAILADHPERIRVLWVDSTNPVNTVAGTATLKQALRELDLLVTVDVAFTETAAVSDYVLPAASVFEKCEFTLFTFDAPANYFHVRAPVLPALPGTLPEPEIYLRLARAMRLLPPEELIEELASKASDPLTFGKAFAATMAADPRMRRLAPHLLYLTLGRTLPGGTAAAAPLWIYCHEVAKKRRDAVAQALGVNPVAQPASVLAELLFRTVVESRSSAMFSLSDETWSLVEHADRKVRLAVPRMLEWMRRLEPASLMPPPELPFVLSAGQRRLQNANQILRDPAAKRADPDGAMYIHPQDLAELGVADQGCVVVESRYASLVVRVHATDSMRRGHVILPHGYGQSHPDETGRRVLRGPALNWLTDAAHRDPIADTPLHKFVPVRLAAAKPGAVVGTVESVP
ncbi:molybdopterin-dependent oxidoreductase [Variovorax sp. LjRoot290]|uniref:molybdopterin-dependent oxidoreductase n=1 Tax=Variovorax sp. LjRoot290 TaxID=3342316 RepID=UPI003ED0D62A